MGPLDLFIIVTVLGGAQFWYTLRFYLRLRRAAAREAPEPRARPVTVFVACRDDSPSFAENIRTLLGQAYPGRKEFIFALASEADPAHAVLQGILAGLPPQRARIVFSRRAPSVCSAKLVNLLAALEQASADSELFVFADSDLRVPPRWLADLAAELEDPAAGATTAAMIYLPCEGFWGFLRCVWMAASVVYFSLMGRAAGQSLAMRRRDFEAWGVAAVWARSLSQDMPVTALVRRHGRRVRFVFSAMPDSGEGCDAGTFRDVFNRWVVCFRVYDPLFWALGLWVTFLKCWVLAWAWRLGTWEPVVYLFCMDAGNLYLVFAVLRARFPERFSAVPARLRHYPLLAAACAPLLWAAYAMNFANSLCRRTVRWAGVAYRIRGPQDVERL